MSRSLAAPLAGDQRHVAGVVNAHQSSVSAVLFFEDSGHPA